MEGPCLWITQEAPVTGEPSKVKREEVEAEVGDGVVMLDRAI